MITLYVFEGVAVRKRYVGITEDLPRRLIEHRNGKTKGGQILGKFTLLHTETFPDYATARGREKFLKSGKGREWLALMYPRACAPQAHSNPPKAD
jgi:putative endonuclease